MDIEPLTNEDYEEVFSFWNSCDGLHMHHDYSETLDGFSSFLERNPGLCFTCRIEGKIIGAVLGSHDGRRGFINHLAVATEYQEKGIGGKLVYKVIEALKSARIYKILVLVLKNNSSAQTFWKQIGFSKEDIVEVHSIII